MMEIDVRKYVSDAAYFMWLNEGSPRGKDREHWRKSENIRPTHPITNEPQPPLKDCLTVKKYTKDEVGEMRLLVLANFVVAKQEKSPLFKRMVTSITQLARIKEGAGFWADVVLNDRTAV